METHEHCQIFPDMDAETFAELKDSIRADGLANSIITFEGKILDGRHRYRACMELGIRPHFLPCPDPDPLKFVVINNKHRRSLTDADRAIVGARIAKARQGDNRFTSVDIPNGMSIPSLRDAAAEMGVSYQTTRRAAAVLKRGAPELVAAMEKKQVTISKAEQLSRLPAERQKEIVAAGPEAWKAKGPLTTFDRIRADAPVKTPPHYIGIVKAAELMSVPVELVAWCMAIRTFGWPELAEQAERGQITLDDAQAQILAAIAAGRK